MSESVCVCVCLQVEKRLELVKQVSHNTHKKLTACLQGQQGVDVDKRSVRSPSVSHDPSVSVIQNASLIVSRPNVY